MCFDHNGKTYKNRKEMAEYYGVGLEVYKSRIKRGWSLEKTLTTPVKTNECKDHLGNIYSSEIDMCAFYKMSSNTYRSRIKYGWSVEKALTTPIYKTEATDHLGNTFSSVTEMCKYWNIDFYLFNNRIRLGWDIKSALTTPLVKERGNHAVKCKDHLNNSFNSIEEMCEYWGITRGAFDSRQKRKWSLEKILTTPLLSSKNGKECKDHLGNIFISVKEMCDFWNIDRGTFQTRIRIGWSLKNALTTPLQNPSDYSGKECKDHLGNIFSSKKEMCSFWNISRSALRTRIENGWSLEEALTIPKHMYIGEYHVAECLKRLNVKFYHNCSIKTIFKDLGVKVDWGEFLESLQSRLGLAGINWSKSKIERLRPDFTLYTDNNNKIKGVIEFDGIQHQNFVEFFFKTIEEFLRRSDTDFVKQDFFEYMGIPMLRIRNDQVDMIDEMVEDFVNHPESYLHGHNTFLSEEEYWSILAEQKAKIEAAFAA